MATNARVETPGVESPCDGGERGRRTPVGDLTAADRYDEMVRTALSEIAFERPLAPVLRELFRPGPSPTAEEAAGLMHASESTLYRECTAVFGAAYGAVASAFALEHAADLAFSKARTLEAIAEIVGLGSASALCRAFKARFGVTTTQFRRRPGVIPLAKRLAVSRKRRD